jgi:HAD superfamily phosphoserine phosphatase-like hydrolase
LNPSKNSFERISAFDLDGTLTKKNSTVAFGLYCCQQGKLPIVTFLKCVKVYLEYLLRKKDQLALHQKIGELFFSHFHLDELKKYHADFLKHNLPKLLYPPALRALQLARERGDYLVLLSNSPDFLVEGFSDLLSFNSFQGSRYEEKKIKYSLDGQGKVKAVEKLLQTYSIPRENIDVYSDSFLDLPFLCLSSDPIAVNPDKRLKKIAKYHQWKTL